MRVESVFVYRCNLELKPLACQKRMQGAGKPAASAASSNHWRQLWHIIPCIAHLQAPFFLIARASSMSA
jgi:hypothetical protein